MSRALAAVSLAVVFAGAAGCNLVTGVDDLAVSSDDVGNGHDAFTPEGVAIDEIAVYQAVKRTVARHGVPRWHGPPVVAGRAGLMRVFLAVDEHAIGTRVTARLTLGRGPAREASMIVRGPSREGDLGSTLNFDLDASDVAEGALYRVELSGPAATSPEASFPVTPERAALPVEPFAAALRVVLVPIAYGGDGSLRLPDTSPKTVAAYERAFLSLYPVAAVDVEVRAPWRWDAPVDAFDLTTWQDLLDGFAAVRAADDAADDAYYFGAFDPADAYGAFCPGGCIQGLGFVVEAALDAPDRAAVGLGFAELVGRIAPHEVGHEHGRHHAPCGGAARPDPGYPEPHGAIGGWGFDVATGRLLAPQRAFDLMGYCEPVWISSYTYSALFGRMEAVGLLGGASSGGASAGPEWHARARLGSDGAVRPLAPLRLARPLQGAPYRVETTTDAGLEVAWAHFAAYDHADGGVLTWPAPARPARRIRVTLAERVIEWVP